MYAISVKPSKSRLYLGLIWGLHLLGLAFVVAATAPPVRYVWVGLLLLSGVWAWRKWRQSAAYFLDIRADGKVMLALQAASAHEVCLQDGGFLSKWLLVMRWQDAQGQRQVTQVWRDSVPKHTFKLLYVWLRWQPQQHEVKRK
ncbi:hypothetical protein LVJ82_04005 [Vitreoscilla massiliensis]|uniref:Toxin CptA n=1 Tax=Vitreoscilla massiliensis TaxID=1689272 RepID=A0ABY4E307_9NEIS|nr:protein YgfX [Vitreoscilla massiliensis]UOO90161.1 hypothetical protein LVJ82_04005 [Vitreoscilla massiliensis]